MQAPTINYQKWLFICIGLMVFGIGVGFIGFPKLLRKMVKGQINTAPGSNIRPVYEKMPFYLNFRIRLFNVTNKEEVIEGKKPKLQEVGPYFFEEWKEKFDMVDDDAEDTLTYHFKNTYKFRPDLSGGLTGDETVVMIHPLIAGMLMAINYDKQPMLPDIEEVLKNMFHNPADAFYTGRAMDLMFNGIPVDCSAGAEHKVTAAVCLTFDDNPSLRKIDDNTYAFSLFGGANATDLGEFKVYRGKKDYRDTGRVISLNGDAEMDYYDGDECNAYVGTDSSIFPAFMPLDEGAFAFESSICRALGATYKYKTKQSGLPVYHFELDMGEDLNVKDCFCRDEDTCPPKGTIDLFRCTGVPMIGSLPHFYLADDLLNGIESGLNPNNDEHGIFMNFEIMTGTPVSAAKRLQFNMDLKTIPSVELVKSVPNVVFPIFWIEESVELPKDLVNQLKYTIFLMIKIFWFLKWFCTVFGAVGSIYCGYMIVQNE